VRYTLQAWRLQGDFIHDLQGNPVDGLHSIARSIDGSRHVILDDTAWASTKRFEGNRDDGNRLNDSAGDTLSSRRGWSAA